MNIKYLIGLLIGFTAASLVTAEPQLGGCPPGPSGDGPPGPSGDGPPGPSGGGPPGPSGGGPPGPSGGGPPGPSGGGPPGPSGGPSAPGHSGPSRDDPSGQEEDGPSGPEPCDEPSWKAGVDEYVQRSSSALKFFVGPTYKTAKTILDAFLTFILKLESSTESFSDIISSKSVEMLETISLLRNVGDSPAGILNGVKDVFHAVAENYKNIILSLADHIGGDTSIVIDAITDLNSVLNQIIEDYENAALPNACNDQTIDYEPVLKAVQNLTNAVASVANAALKNCRNDDNVRDSLYILALILDHLVIKAHATNVSIAAETYILCGSISNRLSLCLEVIDPLISGITKALNSVVKTLLESVLTVLKAIIDLAKSLNAILKATFGLVQDVTKTVFGTLTGATSGLNSIL